MVTRKEIALRSPRELGMLVRETRKAQGISQEQLAGGGCVAQLVRGGDAAAGGRGELQHRVVTQNRAAAAPGFPDGGIVVCHNGGGGGFASARGRSCFRGCRSSASLRKRQV